MDGYKDLTKGRFVRKINRFVAEVIIEKDKVLSHLPNTGRLGELLYEGNQVLLSHHADPNRKTQWTLRYARKMEKWVSIDSQLPNALAQEALNGQMIEELKEFHIVKREAVFGSSRLDFYLEDDAGQGCYLEVKGVTLERDGIAMFPDAPTSRGIRHLGELAQAAENGFRAVVLFVVQMEEVDVFQPNPKDPTFCAALMDAEMRGVEIIAYGVKTEPDRILINRSMKKAPQF